MRAFRPIGPPWRSATGAGRVQLTERVPGLAATLSCDGRIDRGLVQLLWVVRLAIAGPVGLALIFVFGALELLIPVWAERAGRQTPWNRGHIAEPYT